MTEEQQKEQTRAEGAPLAWFHTHGGWSFARRPDGCVSIDSPDGQVTLTADTWASVVASVSAQGESAETFTAAGRFHAGIGHAPTLADDDAAAASS